MRGVLEGLLMAMVITIVGAGMALLGHNVTPADPMRVLAAFFGLWFLGVSLGLLISVLSELAQAFRQIINMAMMPLRSEEHTSALQSLMRNSYAVFCLKKKLMIITPTNSTLVFT